MRLRRVRLKVALDAMLPNRSTAEAFMGFHGACGMVYYPPTIPEMIQGITGWLVLTHAVDLERPDPGSVIVTDQSYRKGVLH